MPLKRQREDGEEDEIDCSIKQPLLETDVEGQQVGTNEVKRSTRRANSKVKSKAKSLIDREITCSLPPLCSENPQRFDTFADYELHYISNHTNTCLECKKNFPSAKLLELHISENHDPFMKIKLQRGEHVFGCFVESCDRMFRDHKKRRLHLIDKHDYPKDYLFSIVDRGIGKKDTSLIKKNTKNYDVWKPA
ncbi:uncharacterized protein C5L36_0D05950 [Pichia kudriavzevii]|uniref:C2H2-type domain-containing protein n=1 Tax=Pichia kudriavzevii TaxID=4909 RepID=A0A2U9RAG5_PICKU|nr:uncharacterized protein C5L36_0D05950 [Pichia kudriavzevii]AWU77869.1 hypothetical protein C5L36_0D05950 [Pichia kudriavzevii]